MSDARDRAETRDLIDTVVELGSVSCGCSVALGLLILGSCVGVATATNPKSGFSINVYVAVISALVIVAFVYLIVRKNVKLKAAAARIEEMNRRAAATAEEAAATEDADSP